VRATAFWILFVLAVAVYAVMVLWSLPMVAVDADGERLLAFDLRPGGYTLAEAQTYVGGLSAAQTAFYLDVQHRLDLVYPPLLAATMALGTFLLAPAALGAGRWPLILPALAAGALDLLENAGVAGLLRAGAAGLTAESVAAASRWSMMKAQATTGAGLLLLALLVLWLVRRMQRRRVAEAERPTTPPPAP
jgi:hypothetical protein